MKVRNGWRAVRQGRCARPSSRCMLTVLVTVAVHGFAAVPVATEPPPPARDELEVTAETLEMDFRSKLAVFQRKVRVSDSRLVLEADRMEVELSSEDDIRKIEATGHVVIWERKTNRRATCGKAVYDVVGEKVVLTEKPVLVDGTRMVTAATKITYDRRTGVFSFLNPEIKIMTGKQQESLFPLLFPKVKPEVPAAADTEPQGTQSDG